MGGRRITQEEFIDQLKEIYGDSLDYSIIKYVDKKTPVDFLCVKHGTITSRTPKAMLLGFGCSICGTESQIRKQSLTFEQFKEKAIKVHGDKYSYDNVEYVNYKTKVSVTCNKHQKDFLVSPSNLLRGKGCPLCGRENTIKGITRTFEQFVQDAEIVHGDKYLYEKIQVEEWSMFAYILCKEHKQIFRQNATSHLQGCGCPLCAETQRRITRTAPFKESFVSRARLAHGDKYDYSLVEYNNCEEKVKIICPIHGEFLSRPIGHLAGRGCAKCSIEEQVVRQRKPVSVFIEQAEAFHGVGKYDYSLVDYKSTKTGVKIICSEHGVFIQTPSTHLKSGCHRCAKYGYKVSSPATLYVLDVESPVFSFVGFGITNDYDTRIRRHRSVLTKHGFKIQAEKQFYFESGADALSLENLLKNEFPVDTRTNAIEGFIRESTIAAFSHVDSFCEKQITQEKQWQH